MTVRQIHRNREHASLLPLEFFLLLILCEGGVTASGKHVNDLFVEVVPFNEGFAVWNFPDGGIHVDVARKVQITPPPANFWPWLDLLSLGIENGVALNH